MQIINFSGMKNLNNPTLLIIIILLFPAFIRGQEKPVRRPYTLTHQMTPEEKSQFYLVGKGYEATDPPPGVIHNVAEFEKMEGVLVTYPGNFGISYDVIAAMSEEVPVTTIVESNSQLTFVTNQYQSHEVNMANTNFLVTDLDSYWCRDYGPWYVRYGDDQIGIVDFIYNRPNRPHDNAIPPQMATYLGINWYGMDLIHTGGNYMTDGYGISSSTELVWEENPTLTTAEINQLVHDYLGIDTYHVVPDPNNTYIDHIDCWGKFLGVDKVLIREVPVTHPQYDEIEATAAYYASQTSSWGDNFKVYRVWTPNNEPYTNSLILNDRVFVPITGGQWDDEAIASYEEAMPGYEVLGFTGTWESTDALHCRTKGIADRNTLYIEHYPLLGDQPVQSSYDIEAEITAYSGDPIVDSSVQVKYRINDIQQDDIIMTNAGDKLYTATIPAGPEGSKMEYYLTAADVDGNTANHPFIGEADPHVFFVGEELFPALALDVTEINAWVNQGNTDVQEFNITNSGQLELNYTLDWSSAVMEDHDFTVEDSPGQNAWNSNTFTEQGWTEFDVDNVVGEIANWTISYHWATDNYPEEGTFYALSPSGTQATIAAGTATGDYTISLDAFNGEQMQGTWRLWITDSYGDGGHQATNITVTITKTYTIYPWLSVEPSGGTVQPGESQTITVTCNGMVMPVGDYTGHINVNSNDPENPAVVIPVYFTVDLPSGTGQSANKEVSISNYPNPFRDHIVFDLFLKNSTNVSLEIFNSNGQRVKTLIENPSVQGNLKVSWDGSNESGEIVRSGIYFYHLKAGSIEKTDKIIYLK